ncbi:hypothetical protein B0F90DRAFT_1930291 [Multifurca ochricompacta]|uniref:Crinkler effector protein N-terminal domain-containing protein n=1 Tax=Multifurca ochricompacta TaxID=376703 RepID=A0AAD4QDJ7_9AGAM|nr:hypothetical protein B0F90DRAFT_1930291 [Multifurca ochricompacta]
MEWPLVVYVELRCRLPFSFSQIAMARTKTLSLFCLAIDTKKDLLGDVFKVTIQSDGDTSDLGKIIKAEMANQLSHLAADELIIWKLSTHPPIDPASNRDEISTAIKAIVFPSTAVQELRPTKELSQYWKKKYR